MLRNDDEIESIDKTNKTNKKDVIAEVGKDFVIRRSDLFDDDQQYQPRFNSGVPTNILQDKILAKFNSKVRKPFYVKTLLDLGWCAPKNYHSVQSGQFFLGARNQVPELVAGDGNYYISRELHLLNAAQTTQDLGVVNVNTEYYGAYGNHVLNVPVGKYALAFTQNNQPRIYDAGTHVITNDFTFTLNNPRFSDQNQNHIKHGPIHIVRVKPGKIAAAWSENKPYFLEARDEPYYIYDPLFKIEPNQQGEEFQDVNTQLIVHGNKKRVIVNEGFVAVGSKGGKLHILEPSDDGRPHELDDPNYSVLPGLIPVNTATVNFPSDRMREKRRRDNPRASDAEINNFVYTTSDNTNVSVQLAVIFKITDAKKAIAELRRDPTAQANIYDEILKHIETLADTDMNKAIKECTQQEFTSYNQTKAMSSLIADNLHKVLNETEKKPPQKTFRDYADSSLSKHLEKYGIELISLNIESFNILNPDIAKKLSEQAYESAKVNTEAANLAQRTLVEQGKKKMDASLLNIEADGKVEAAKKNAQATQIIANAERDKHIAQAQGDKEATQLKADAEFYAKQKEAEGLALSYAALSKAFEDPNVRVFELAKRQYEMYGEAMKKAPAAQRVFFESDGKTSVGTSPFSLFGTVTPETKLTGEPNLQIQQGPR